MNLLVLILHMVSLVAAHRLPIIKAADGLNSTLPTPQSTSHPAHATPPLPSLSHHKPITPPLPSLSRSHPIIPPLPSSLEYGHGPLTPPIPNGTASSPKGPPSTSSATLITDTVVWSTLPISQLSGDPYCVNAADPDNGIGNHCICKNGVTLSNIPWTGGANGNWSNCKRFLCLVLFTTYESRVSILDISSLSFLRLGPKLTSFW